MQIPPVRTPKLLQRVFPGLVWHILTEEKILYLTFDDGPTPNITPWVLDTLRRYKAKATFFCVGDNIEKHPDLFRQIVEEGHAVGNHTYNHVKGWRTSVEDYLKNVEKTHHVMSYELEVKHNKNVQLNNIFITHNPKLFRPPYGQITPSQIRALKDSNYTILMWTILSFDWDQTISKETCAEHVIHNAKHGDIIVFHDSLKAKKNLEYALEHTLEYFSERGYRFNAIIDRNI